MSKRAGVIFILSVLCLGVLVAHAQVSVDANARKFLLAATYMKGGQYERAIPILEDLYADDPSTNAYFLRLKESYTELKRYQDAIDLIDHRMGDSASPYLLSERGALLFRMDDESGAFDAWRQAVDIAPTRSLPYREVYRAMLSVRLYDAATDLLLQARDALDYPGAFRAELAELYSSSASYGLAMEEYVAMILESPDQEAYVRSRLTRLSQADEMFDESLPIIERTVRENPLNRAIRELSAWMYRESGQYDRALETNRAIDRLEGEEGRVLFAFALNAADAGATEQAFAALAEIIDAYPGSPSAVSAELATATLRQLVAEQESEVVFDKTGNRIPAPNYDAALVGYRTFIQSHGEDPRIPDVLWRMSQLQLNVFRELGEAEALLIEIISRHPGSPVADQARFDIGVTYLLRDDLTQARLAFSRLENELRIGELAEKSRFELALISFYEGHFESALAFADALDQNTSTDIANDAIELKVLLQENRGPDSLDTPLRKYARAQLFHRQRRFQEALSLLVPLLLSYQSHALCDEIRFWRASNLRELARFEEAISAFSEIVAENRESYLADRSLFAVGEIYERGLKQPALALDAYSNLLVEFPGSLLAPEVRARIRKIRGDQV
ncbi:MAG: tetratricopeptide repeat protein [Rhodothermia bacterium]